MQTQKDCIIRKPDGADLPLLLALSRKVITANFRSFMDGAVVDEYVNSGMADREITGNLENMLLLTEQNRVIGLCVWKENLLHLLMIDSDFQGRGAGGRFLTRMETDKFRDYHTLYLECFGANTVATRFYAKHGWKVYKTETDAQSGQTRLFYKKTA